MATLPNYVVPTTRLGLPQAQTATVTTPTTSIVPTVTTPAITTPIIQPKTTTIPQTQTIQGYVAGQTVNPVLPTGTEIAPILQNPQSNELLTNNTHITTTPVQPVQAQYVTIQDPATGQAYNVDVNQILPYLNNTTGQVTPTLTTSVGEMQAAQGQVSELATVQGQLKKLYGDTEDGKTPEWAQGAVRKAENEMAARGLGSSSISAAAITEAIQQSAINIAAPDAASYFQMDMANLSNEQQARLQNIQMKQQNMLTDVSIQNATAQFNATNAQQIQTFTAQLIASIQQTNADRQTAVSQFNASESNKIKAQNAANFIDVQKFNAQQANDINKFVNQLDFNRDTFNAQMGFAIDQSNVLWRRQINTQNTAALNAANETNVQNKYNISQSALNNIWQQWRDEQSWLFTSNENQKTRNYNAAQAANNRQYAEDVNNDQWLTALGQLAGTLLF